MALNHRQLLARQRGLGGTDVAAILGLNPWKAPVDIVNEKHGLVAPSEESEPAHWGNMLEPALCAEYEQREGVRLLWNQETIIGPEPFMMANPDWFVLNRRKLVEGKTSGQRGEEWGDPETDEVPIHYHLQGDWYMACCNMPELDIIALFGSPVFHADIFRLVRNPALEERIVGAAKQFWESFIVGDMPLDDEGFLSLGGEIRHLFRRNTGRLLEGTPEVERLVLQYIEFEELADRAIQLRDETRREIEKIIMDYDGIKGEGWKVTWRNAKSRRVTDWQMVAAELGALNPEEFHRAVAGSTRMAGSGRRFMARHRDKPRKRGKA